MYGKVRISLNAVDSDRKRWNALECRNVVEWDE